MRSGTCSATPAAANCVPQSAAVVRCTLGELPSAPLRSPSVIVVGDVVGDDLAAREPRRLDGLRVVVTRAAWEQACVDPDGTVRPIDYFQSALGNLAEEPFLSLWQGERAQRVRAQALMRIDSSRREHCSE